MASEELGAGLGTGWPGFLDTKQTYNNKSVTIPDGPTRPDAELFNDILAAILALQTELGTDPAGASADLKTRLTGINEAVEGILFVNDTANSNMTTGLTVNQGANDDQILALKSSDVATVLTTLPDLDTETDDYFTIGKFSGAGGGVNVQAMAVAANGIAFQLQGFVGAPQITDTTGTSAVLHFVAAEHDGANALTAPTANASIFSIAHRTTSGTLTRLVLKGDDGELHLGVTTPVQLDDHDDHALLEDFENYRTDCQLKTDFQDMLTSGCYERLVGIGVISRVGNAREGITEEEAWNGGVRPLHSVQRLAQLSIGEARQKQKRLEAIVDVLESSDPAFKGKLNAAMIARGIGHLAQPM